MNRSDAAVVEAVRAGEKESYAILVERYQQAVYNLMWRFTLDRDEAVDLTQEVFVRAFDRLWSYRTDGGFFPWLYTLAINRAKDWRRKRTRTRAGMDKYDRQVEADKGSASTDQQRQLETWEERARLDRAMGLLPELTREILILRYRHECSVREVARVFNMTESGAKMRIKRGLEQLQLLMREKEDGRD